MNASKFWILTFGIILITNHSYGQFKSVKIGNQIWMSENLNVDRFRNGDLIPEAKTIADWGNSISLKLPAWRYYNNDPQNGYKYGKLYNWFAVNDPRGLAPSGWQIPSKSDWEVLINHLGGSKNAASKMKAKEGWGNAINSNSSGFSGLPGGVATFDGEFRAIGVDGSWWTSTICPAKVVNNPVQLSNNGIVVNSNSPKSYTVQLYSNLVEDIVGIEERFQAVGLSVRCVRDGNALLKNNTYNEKNINQNFEVYQASWTYENVKYNGVFKIYNNEYGLCRIKYFLNGEKRIVEQKLTFKKDPNSINQFGIYCSDPVHPGTQIKYFEHKSDAFLVQNNNGVLTITDYWNIDEASFNSNPTWEGLKLIANALDGNLIKANNCGYFQIITNRNDQIIYLKQFDWNL